MVPSSPQELPAGREAQPLRQAPSMYLYSREISLKRRHLTSSY